MFFENIKLALKDFSNNRLRTLLSMLGIVIGIGSVITITTLGHSATVSVQKQVSQAGLETIMVFRGRDSSSEVRRLFTLELASAIRDDIDGVKAVSPVNQGNYFLKYGKSTYEGARVMGVDDDFPQIFDYEATEGGFFSSEDDRMRRSVVVLGAEIAEALFPGDRAVGKYVRIFRPSSGRRKSVARSFKVVGVMRAKTQTMGNDFDASVYVPYNTYSHRLERIENVQRYSIGTLPGVDVLAVAERIDEFFLKLTGNEDSYRVISPSTIAEMFTGITETLNLFLTGVAAISLIVGGIGIMNIMLVSVSERTKEIGVRKALGAAPRVIRGQFLTEAVTLTMFGGILGMAIGTGLSYLGTYLLRWVFAPQPTSYVLAVLFSSAVGIFFGLYPAIRASRLDPVAALTFE